ncbi:transcriptional coactivator PipX [Leptolyngbya sp. AN02str]|uniref:transcriptional coactivator PipX n=1 Tax=Leptolyngbya sp. AN02str TaxID=3423363 RepID=UPI003D314EDD
MKSAQIAQIAASVAAQGSMNSESYLNHPTFGLLYRVCHLEVAKELFATLYAQRLFFMVTTSSDGVQFDPMSRADARVLLENRLRTLRREGDALAYTELQRVYKQTFQ